MNERVARGEQGLILYDCGQLAALESGWLQPQWWDLQGKAGAGLGGRGGARVVQTPVGPAVLRRFWRGGWMASILKDRYFRVPADYSRAFREFRLLSRLRDLDLPVPQPLAASFEPAGLFYRAGLMTRWLPDTRQLAEVADELSASEWRQLGLVLARFFQAGLIHPDLNAHNLLLDTRGRWHVIDFDRAQLLGRPVAAQGMIERLARSLRKQGSSAWRAGFDAHLRPLG